MAMRHAIVEKPYAESSYMRFDEGCSPLWRSLFYKILLMSMLISLNAVAASEVESAAAFVFLKPERSSFWRTATNNTVSLPVDSPHDARSATIMVRGDGYEATYEDVPTGMFNLKLPPAERPEQENVYDITLAFKDGPVRSAKIAVISGRKCGVAEGVTRCVRDSSRASWKRTARREVIPIAYNPSGKSEITVDGERKDTGLDGAQGWYALGGIAVGEKHTLAYEADGCAYAAEFTGYLKQFSIIVR